MPEPRRDGILIKMIRRTFPLLALALAFSAVVFGQDRGTWRAVSTNARSITGDLVISGAKLTINMTGFTLANIRSLTPADAAAVFGTDPGAPGNGTLYRLSVPPDRRFLHHNTLCGDEETQWMATWVEGRNLQVAFFSGSNMPTLTADALANASDVCGLFTYTRW